MTFRASHFQDGRQTDESPYRALPARGQLAGRVKAPRGANTSWGELASHALPYSLFRTRNATTSPLLFPPYTRLEASQEAIAGLFLRGSRSLGPKPSRAQPFLSSARASRPSGGRDTGLRMAVIGVDWVEDTKRRCVPISFDLSPVSHLASIALWCVRQHGDNQSTMGCVRPGARGLAHPPPPSPADSGHYPMQSFFLSGSCFSQLL